MVSEHRYYAHDDPQNRFSPLKNYAASVSLLTVLETVTRSDVPLALRLLLPFRIATSKRINKAPPATQTHGDVYQVVSSFKVVVVVVVDVESCAQTNDCIRKKIKRKKAYLIPEKAFTCFIKMFLNV